MNIYETVKAAVTVRNAAEHYGLKVSHNGMTCCPFHNDRHPSLKLNEDYFYCFGCLATGDVIDFTARLYGLRNYEAAQKLAQDFGVDVAGARSIPAKAPARRTDEKARMCQKALDDYERLLRSWKEEYAPWSTVSEPDKRFVEACHWLEYVEYLADSLATAKPMQRAEMADSLVEDGIIGQIKERLESARKEATRHERDDERAAG